MNRSDPSDDPRRMLPPGVRRGPRRDLYSLLPPATRHLLDVGCAEGLGFAELRQRGVEVVGVDVRPQIAALASRVLNHVFCLDAESLQLPPEYAEYFDAIVFADSLEHLSEPSLALTAARRHMRPDGVLVLSVPNLRYWRVIIKLLLGRWDYAATGILSRHHLRFFTRFSLTNLLEGVGFQRLRFTHTDEHIHGLERVFNALTGGVFWEFLSKSLNVSARRAVFTPPDAP